MISENSWGFSNPDEFVHSKNCEDAYGADQPNIINKFKYNFIPSLEFHKLISTEKICLKTFQIVNDFDEYSLHSVSQLMLDYNCLVCPDFSGGKMFVISGNFDTKVINSKLRLEFIEIESENNEYIYMVDHPDLVKYLIISNLVKSFFNNGWISIGNEEQFYGQLGKYNTITSTYQLCAIKTISMDYKDNLKAILEVDFKVYRYEELDRIKHQKLNCEHIHTGETFIFDSICNLSENNSFKENIRMKKYGYNKYLPENFEEMKSFYLYRYGVKNISQLIGTDFAVIRNDYIKMVVPFNTLSKSMTYMPSRTRRESALLAETVGNFLRQCLIFSHVADPKPIIINNTTSNLVNQFTTARKLKSLQPAIKIENEEIDNSTGRSATTTTTTSKINSSHIKRSLVQPPTSGHSKAKKSKKEI